ncbi:hypothetical protein [Bacillus cereus]|uniref:hypothetical protein n=1 Tax=Bacillus cereus TaxID=1396 RepID=UPI0021192780|nr:hypothetical protein [Bacillus cereus]
MFVIPDVRVLQNFAYSFMLHFQLIDWPVINQLLCMVGGLLWGATAHWFISNGVGEHV